MIDDVQLIDEAVAAVASLNWPPPLRETSTRVQLVTRTEDGFAGGVFVDADKERVHVACYPFPDSERIPQEQLQPVAELMNLIACTGVDFALALDLEHGVISMRNRLCFAGTNATDRASLLRDLITGVANSRILYEHPLRRVAFEGVDPATALADFEQRLNELSAG